MTLTIYIDPTISLSIDCFDNSLCDGSYAKPYSNIAYLVHLHTQHEINKYKEAEITILLMKGVHYFLDGLL